MKRFPFVVFAVFALDQGSKGWIEARLPLGHSVPLWPCFAFTHVRNTGAAFGLLARSNTLFIGLTVVLLALLFKMRNDLISEGPWARTGVAFVWGGALGNLADRVRNGAVTDFLDVFWRGWHWPAFNVADAAITVGVSLLILQRFRKGPR